LVFEKIVLHFDNDFSVKINKQVKDKSKFEINFRFFDEDKKIDELIYNDKNDIYNQIERVSPQFRRIDAEKWLDRKTDTIMRIDEIENYLNPNFLFAESENNFRIKNPKVINLLKTFKVHLIKEQRLFKKIEERNGPSSLRERNSSYMTDTIREYAKELNQEIEKTLQKSLQISQELDSSFPKRLLSEAGKLTAEEFSNRFIILKDKQSKLKEYGLSESEQEVPDFDQENAKVLFVYLKDSERKISIFDNLLAKLELFTNILNDRRFTFKSIKIHKEKGFIFWTDQGKELNLTDLSSGEQHEVVLLYELIFKTEENTLVLIDEPEISLHITWQKEFLNDLLRIIDLQKMQVIVATHSPQIINGRWDLVYNLENSKN
jgi:predicted ATP-binding protein involved in virulence